MEEEFNITRLLGVGGFAKVFEASRRLGITGQKGCAIKIVKKQDIMPLDATALFKEIEVLQLLKDHQQALQLETAYETPSRVYIVTELLGKPFCHDDGSDVPVLDERSIREVLIQMLTPLEFLHAHGIVHRDVKPENYLHVNEDTGIHLKLIDFGMVDYEANIPHQPLWLGTLQYQSPEMVSQQVYDRKIDCWAIGVIAYLLLTQKLPFYDYEQKNRFIIIEKIKAGQFCTDIGHLRTTPTLDFVSKLLELCPSERCSIKDALRHPWLIEAC